MRRVIAALVVVGLAIGVFLLWPRSPEDGPPVTAAGPTTTTDATSTTTTMPDTTTTTNVATTTTSVGPESHVVETVEEAEEILRELWFGWFEAIYNHDEDRIREVVATRQFLEAGFDALGSLNFNSEPSLAGLEFAELEILHSSADCLAVWSVTEPSFLGTSEPRSGVEVLRFVDGWRFATSWKFKDDLWEADCGAELQPLP